ncbi:Uncharacterised protein [Mycobacteroides abscessus]|nr:Uncharacterised protein [Mycobacteroides abscessus]
MTSVMSSAVATAVAPELHGSGVAEVTSLRSRSGSAGRVRPVMPS